MISTSTLNPTLNHPYFGQQGWKTLLKLAYQMLLILANQGLQQKAEKLSISQISCFKITHARPTQTRS
jgi:hypothetical protein